MAQLEISSMAAVARREGLILASAEGRDGVRAQRDKPREGREEKLVRTVR